MGKLDGRVAIITGGARGQGRTHAVALAREGADVVLADVPAEIGTLPYATARADDLAATVDLVTATGRRCLGLEADVRDPTSVRRVVDTAIAELGHVDIFVANHGICSYFELRDMSDDAWQDMIDVNLTGSFNCLRAILPHMVDRGYGRVVVTASGLARQGQQQVGHYIASKWGILGLVKSAALEVASAGVTVNAILPTTVNTPMIMHDAMYRLFRPDLPEPTADDMVPILSQLNAIPVPWVEPEDITHGVMFLVSDEARYVTGGGLDVGAGWNARSSA